MTIGVPAHSGKENELRLPLHPAHLRRIPEDLRRRVFLEHGYGERFGVSDEPQLVRDALAGEDDAEDVQWLVVVEDPDGTLDAAALDEFVAGWDGWREAH